MNNFVPFLNLTLIFYFHYLCAVTDNTLYYET